MSTHPAFRRPAHWLAPPTTEFLAPASPDAPALDGSAGVFLNLGQNQWFAWRATLEIENVPDNLEVRIALDSKYFLWINGELIVREGGLKRGPSPDGSYCDRVGIAPFLRVGANQIAVLHWYFGRDSYSHADSGTPFFVFDVPANLPMNWRVRRHPAFSNAPNLANGFRLSENSIIFDAREEMESWTNSEFDDSTWLHPETIEPAMELVERPIPFWRDYGVRQYSHVERATNEDGAQIWTAKLPYNCQFSPTLRVYDAIGGRTIAMHTDNPKEVLQAHYVTRAGEQEFECWGWLSGESAIYSFPDGIEVREIGFRETSYATDFVGEFECDDEMLNALWRKAARTLLINIRDTFMDCPERERAPWWGDIVVQQSQVFCVFDERAHQLIRKSFRELSAWQRADNTLFTPCPAGLVRGELPDQMLASVGFYGAWIYAFFADDFETLRAVYPAIKSYLDVWKQDENGIAIVREGDWFWGDWGVNIDQAVIQNCWLMLALRAAILTARKFENVADEAHFSARAQALQASFHDAFWSGDAYQSEYCPDESDDRAQALAVLSGLAAPETFALLREHLESQRFASPYMEKYVLEALFGLDAPDVALRRMRERFGEMTKSPNSTLWEHWKASSGSLNHSWSGGPLTLLSARVAGIQPLEAGFARFIVRPQTGDLNRVRCCVPTKHGTIETRWQRENNGATFEINVPSNCVAQVELQAPFDDQNGRWRFDDNADSAELSAGNYRAVWDGSQSAR